MRVLLEGLLPRLFPGLPFTCVTHEGKQDLEKSIPRKLRAWREPGVRFVVLRDNDGENCREVKAKLLELCAQGKQPDVLVRVVCQELESWYFGAPDALASAFDRDDLAKVARKARFRDPDEIDQPSKALVKLVEEFQKVSGARMMAKVLTRENRSRSFQALMAGLDRLFPKARAK